jgi:hypothetical protein
MHTNASSHTVKSVCPQWRTRLISKCVRENLDEDVRLCALTYLPYLIYSLGVSANSLVFQLVHPAMLEEKTPNVLIAYANMLDTLCCLISRKCVLVRKGYFDCSCNSLNYTNYSNKYYVYFIFEGLIIYLDKNKHLQC